MPFRDECGIFGIAQHQEAANFTYLGLYALQHRGQEAAGICSSLQGKLTLHKAQGYVADVFDEHIINSLKGTLAIGHTRYSTTGGNVVEGAQPFLRDTRWGRVALCHNGNLTNTESLRSSLIASGESFGSSSDTEVMLALIARSAAATLKEAIVDALRRAQGAFSILILHDEILYAARDPYGFRPLVLGQEKDAYVLSSESCAFDLISARYLREVEPGELLVICSSGVQSEFPWVKQAAHPCVFEHVYFSRPDSFVNSRSVMKNRRKMGQLLAKRHPVEADIVIPVPDSGVPAALGFAEAMHIPLDFGLIRNHYVGRTFIEPKQSIRSFGVRIKLNPIRHLIEGRRVVLVDDSIVRGTTSKKIVDMVRQCGAKEVHFRVSSPPTTHSCFYGIDTPSPEHLIASQMTLGDINTFIGSDSLGYLTLEDLSEAVGDPSPGKGFCYACFTGDYPVAPVTG